MPTQNSLKALISKTLYNIKRHLHVHQSRVFDTHIQTDAEFLLRRSFIRRLGV
jgi:hypothetical protein